MKDKPRLLNLYASNTGKTSIPATKINEDVREITGYQPARVTGIQTYGRE